VRASCGVMKGSTSEEEVRCGDITSKKGPKGGDHRGWPRKTRREETIVVQALVAREGWMCWCHGVGKC